VQRRAQLRRGYRRLQHGLEEGEPRRRCRCCICWAAAAAAVAAAAAAVAAAVSTRGGGEVRGIGA